MKRIFQLRWWLTAIAFLGSCWHAAAQRLTENVEPQLFRGQISGGSVGIYIEGVQEDTHYQSGLDATHERFFEGPLFGLGVSGSIYHPNLLTYDLNGDFAVGWTQEKTTVSNGGGTVNRSEFDYLGNFGANASLLRRKPYAANFFVTSGHTYRDYDFFNRVTVDTLRYGVNSGYSEGPVPVHFSLTRYTEDTTGFGFGNSLDQTTLSVDAHNDRASGRTTLTYTLNDFDRQAGTSHITGTENSIGVADSETFGAQKNIEWRNEAAVTERNFTDSSGEVFTGGSHLRIEHRPNLISSYDGTFLRDDTDSTVTENYDGSAGVQHRLFASLISGLRVQVTRYTSERPGSDFESTQYIGTWSEAYTKKLSESARLTISGSLGRSHTDQTSSSTVQIVGEAHTFNSGGGPFVNSFFLNVLNVNPASIEIFDASRTIHYTENVDYSVTVVGARTVIQLIEPNPSGLTSSTPLVVDYEAAPQGTGSIDGTLADAQIRLELMNGMWGFYGRYSDSDYTGDSGIIVQDTTSLAFGVDFFRKWLRAGLEYQIYDSTFSSYTAARAYQTLSFAPDEASSLSINFSEGWTDYKTANRTEQFYSAIARYHRGLTRHLGFDFETGASERSGSVVDQFLAAVRPGISYNVGKLLLKAGYDFEYQETQHNQERVKQTFFLRLRRAF